MRCNVCQKVIPVAKRDICHFCNFVVCMPCQIENKGTPTKRLFLLETDTVCYKCFSKTKYEKEDLVKQPSSITLGSRRSLASRLSIFNS